MPVTIRTREMAVKNPSTGNYDTFDTVAVDVNDETETKVNRLTDLIDKIDPVVLTNHTTSKNRFAITSSMLDIDWYGLTYHRNVDGSYSINGTAAGMGDGKNYVITWLFGATDYKGSVIPAGTYYFSLTEMVGVSFLTIKYVYGDDDTAPSTTIVSHSNTSAKITFTEPAHVFVQISKDKVFNNASFKCQIESCADDASAPTDYEIPAGPIDTKARNLLSNLHKAFPDKVAYASYRCQGGCLVGNVFTWLLYNSANKVVKHSLDVITGKRVSATLPDGTDTSTLYHCNDLTYNPTNYRYYVATLLSDGKIAVLNSNFVYESSVVPVDGTGNPVIACGIAYNRLADQYIIASNDDSNFYIYDNAWTYVKTVVPNFTEVHVRQGIETDGYYLYRTRVDPASTSDIVHSYIQTYTMQGTYLGEYTIEQLVGEEIEGIAYDWDNGVFFINTNLKGSAETRVYLIQPNSMSYHAVDTMAYMIKRLFV